MFGLSREVVAFAAIVSTVGSVIAFIVLLLLEAFDDTPSTPKEVFDDSKWFKASVGNLVRACRHVAQRYGSRSVPRR